MPPSDVVQPLSPARRYPVTLVLGFQYVVLVLWPAWRSGEDRHFVYLITAVGLAAVFAAESAIYPISIPSGRTWIVEARPAAFVGVVGLVAFAASAGFGYATYAAQVGTRDVSALASVFTPFTAWLTVGAALLVYSYKEGHCSRKVLLWILGLLLAGHLLIATVLIGRLAPSMEFALTIGVLCLLAGVVKLRMLVAVSLVMLALAWPLLYETRNETRLQAGGNRFVLSQETAQERVQLDRFLELAANTSIDRSRFPGALDTLRYGLIPRILDPNRPPLSSGLIFSVASGGPASSAIGFTLFGSLYAVYGWIPMVLILVTIAFVVGALSRRRGPIAWVCIALIIDKMLWIDSLYPDAVVDLLQGIVAATLALIALRMWTIARGDVRKVGASPQSHPERQVALSTHLTS
jgi:hypothetical protein